MVFNQRGSKLILGISNVNKLKDRISFKILTFSTKIDEIFFLKTCFPLHSLFVVKKIRLFAYQQYYTMKQTVLYLTRVYFFTRG